MGPYVKPFARPFGGRARGAPRRSDDSAESRHGPGGLRRFASTREELRGERCPSAENEAARRQRQVTDGERKRNGPERAGPFGESIAAEKDRRRPLFETVLSEAVRAFGRLFSARPCAAAGSRTPAPKAKTESAHWYGSYPRKWVKPSRRKSSSRREIRMLRLREMHGDRLRPSAPRMRRVSLHHPLASSSREVRLRRRPLRRRRPNRVPQHLREVRRRVPRLGLPHQSARVHPRGPPPRRTSHRALRIRRLPSRRHALRPSSERRCRHREYPPRPSCHPWRHSIREGPRRPASARAPEFRWTKRRSSG